MKKEDHFALPDSFILPHYALIATLMVLLDKSELNHAVKKHCKTGLRVIGIIHADAGYNTGTNLLLNKKFDAFFALFPTEFFNNRELLPAIMIIENIEQCIKNNDLECVDS